jgi:hypothetical protein
MDMEARMGKVTVNQTLLDELTAKAARATFKADRQALVDSIVVEVEGKLFDGDEVAQGRMARAAIAMTDEEVVLWVLADNTPTQCTRAELLEALRLAGERQTQVWVYNG